MVGIEVEQINQSKLWKHTRQKEEEKEGKMKKRKKRNVPCVANVV